MCACFIELTTDPFADLFSKRYKDRKGRAGNDIVRRPLRGLEIKDDTYAVLRVTRADGTQVPFMDSSSSTGKSFSYSNFILQSVQESRMEKHQIIETFGDSYLYFFGDAPAFLDVQAVLINSQDFNWEAEWWDNWENVLRGSKSVENGARTYLFYDDNIVEGYMLQAQAIKVSSEPFMVQMSWRMFVASYHNVSSIGDPNFPVAESVMLPPDVTLTNADAFSRLNPLYPNGIDSTDSLQDWGDNVERTAEHGTVGDLADYLARGSRSVAFPPTVQAYVDNLRANGQDSQLFDLYKNRPLRSLISDNKDEYTGAHDITVDYQDETLPAMMMPEIRDAVECDDLFYDAISWMACFGANINSFTALASLGMGVNFGTGTGIGIGFGHSVSAGVGPGASYAPTPMAGVGFGGSIGRGFGFGTTPAQGFSAGSYAGSGAYGYVGSSAGTSVNGFGAGGSLGGGFTSGQLSAMQGNAMFSSGTNSAAGIGQNRQIGDPNYGYDSPYGGPGYGRAGFGDFGGVGYGSSFGAMGDPGHMPVANITMAGVENESSDLDRLIQNQRRGYGAGFGGVGAGDSYAGSGGGACISVGGAISAFAMSVVPGTLMPSGNAFTATGKPLGFAPPNPYGVPCLGGTNATSFNLLQLI